MISIFFNFFFGYEMELSIKNNNNIDLQNLNSLINGQINNYQIDNNNGKINDKILKESNDLNLLKLTVDEMIEAFFSNFSSELDNDDF